MNSDSTIDMHAPVGTVYLPGGGGTPVGQFQFLVDPGNGRHIEIGTLVTADTDEGPVVGVVVDMRTVGTDTDPVSADLSRRPEDRVGYIPAVRCADVQVLSSGSLRPVGAGQVRAASAAEVTKATAQDKMAWPIPIGTVRLADGTMTPVCVDGEFLLGPEAQGLNIFGRSGVASKTSFMTVAARSALAAGNPDNHRTAMLVFSVKGEDLIWLDHTPEADKALTDTDRAIYEAMGLPPTPFDNVTVYAVSAIDGAGNTSVRSDAELLSWDLRMAWRYINMFVNMFADEKMAAFIANFDDNLLHHPDPSRRVDTFEKLNNWFSAQIAAAEDEGSDYIWNGLVHIATARRLRRTFNGIHSRGRGLFSNGAVQPGSFDIPDSGWNHGDIRVVDLAGLSTEVQGFVIARTVDRLMRAAEGTSNDGGTLGVDHLIIATDELNTWAPSGSAGEVDQVRKSLRRVATQGRYAGLSLFGAAQAASKIDDLLRDNSATKAIGSSAESELTSGVHGRLPGGIVERIATLPKGQMAVWHTAFRQPLVVNFPRPAWKMGRSQTTGGQRHTTQSLLRNHLGAKAYERVTKGLDDEQIEAFAAAGGGIEGAVKQLASAADQTPNVVHAPRDVDANNPFNLD